MSSNLTRRTLGRLLGATAGAALLDARFPASLSAAVPARTSPAGPIRLSANENPYGPCRASLDALARSASDANRYPGAIEEELRAAVAKHLGVATEQIVLGCGSSDILRMADSAFVPEGKSVVVAEPTFEAVLLYCQATKGQPVKVPQTPDHRHDLVGMAAACDAKTGMVYVCNPNNPTGTVTPRAEIDAFVAAVPRDAVVLIDEAYIHLCDEPRGVDLVRAGRNVVLLRTFSKIFGMAGIRAGFAIARKDLLARMTPWSAGAMPATAMAAAHATLGETELIAARKRGNADRRSDVMRFFDAHGFRYTPSVANHLMVDARMPSHDVIDGLKRQNVYVGRPWPAWSTHVRVTIGSAEDMERFKTAFLAVTARG